MTKRRKPRRTQTQKPVYGGRNEEFALAMIRHVPKSRNKTKYHRPSEKKRGYEE